VVAEVFRHLHHAVALDFLVGRLDVRVFHDVVSLLL
jgi:hypothetical protein